MNEKFNGENVEKESVLSDVEMSEIRQMIARIKAEQEQAAKVQYYEKLSSTRSKARWTLKTLLDKCRGLKEYRGAEYVGHKPGNTILELPSGKAVGFGFAGHASGAAGNFYETFKFWDFECPKELYRLPKHLGDEFFERGMAFVEGIFGKDAEGLERLMNEVEREGDPFQLTILQFNAEDLTSETRTVLATIAQSVKGKAEEEERRSLRIKITRRIGAVRFYLEEHLSS